MNQTKQAVPAVKSEPKTEAEADEAPESLTRVLDSYEIRVNSMIIRVTIALREEEFVPQNDMMEAMMAMYQERR